MVQVLAGEIPIHEYATDYDITVTPIESDNTFPDVNGKKIGKIQGYETVVSCTLKKVPHNIAVEIAKIVKAEEFDLTYTTPISITEKFKCTKYEAAPKSSDPREKNPLNTDKITWNISVIFKSVGGDDENADGL